VPATTSRANVLLPDPVVQALADPPAGTDRFVAAAGYSWFVREWGDAAGPPLLLIHGVTSDADTFWRLGPALAAAGRHVIAIDLPGHGRTGGWRGRHRFAETASDVAALAGALGLDRALSELAVLGHSWGGMVAAALPAAGLAPRTLILLDPPCLPLRYLDLMTKDPEEQPTPDLDEAIGRFGAAHPDWAEGDVLAKAVGVTRFDVEAVRAVLLDNGDWDAGLAALADPAAAASDVWLIRGDPKAGCLIPDAAIPGLVARLGADHVVTLAGAPHSPQRTHIEPLVGAILDAVRASTPA
jgi:pimeloyl-ACP methyl ester carboxylesterase